MRIRGHVLVNAFPFCRRLTTSKARHAIPPPPPPPKTSTLQKRIDSVISRTPKIFRPTLSGLRNAPISHVTAFLILHELTAVLPLFGLAGVFHYFQWLPPYFAEGRWIASSVERFGRYFRKKGWISDSEEAEAERLTKEEMNAEKDYTSKSWFGREKAVRWVIEFGTAYALVKALLPLRLFISAWGAPWFSRWAVIPVGNRVSSLFRRTS